MKIQVVTLSGLSAVPLGSVMRGVVLHFKASLAFVLLSGAGGLLRLRRAR